MTSFKSDVAFAGAREQVTILDISAVGMKAFFLNPVRIGTTVSGKLEIPYSLSRFYVEGEVTRVRLFGGAWEIAIRFDKIRTCPAVENRNNYLLN